MTGYEQFITTGTPNTTNILWEIEVDTSKINNMIDFIREFIKSQGFNFTIEKVNGFSNAVYTKGNNKYVYAGAAIEGIKTAIKIQKI